MSKNYPRRQFIQKMAYVGTGLFGTLWMSCNSKKEAEAKTPELSSCDDFSALTETDLKTRESYGYVAQSPTDDQLCSNCNLYLPHKKLQNCGGCLLFKGPVQGQGFCTSWAPKVERGAEL